MTTKFLQKNKLVFLYDKQFFSVWSKVCMYILPEFNFINLKLFSKLYYNLWSPRAAVSSDVDECLLGLSRCENGATCINTIGGYECICRPGFTGPLCSAGMSSRFEVEFLYSYECLFYCAIAHRGSAYKNQNILIYSRWIVLFFQI